jgi:hypothetical protein
MDWQLVIDRNREALLALITALMASLGLKAGGKLTTLPQFLVSRALLIIRPAESALRRVIMIAALALEQRGIALRRPRGTPTDFSRLNRNADPRQPTFNLIDPLKTFSGETPDYSTFGRAEGEDSGATDRTPVPAEALGRRLLALKKALESIPREAKRLARWYQQRDLALKQNQPHRLSPIRPGPPPWSHRHKRSEMDKLLTECHLMAIYARDRQDSS